MSIRRHYWTLRASWLARLFLIISLIVVMLVAEYAYAAPKRRDIPIDPTAQVTEVAPVTSVVTSSNSDSLSQVLLVAVIVMAVLLVGMLLFFVVWQPRQRRRLLVQAQQLVARGNLTDLQDADTLLGRAITAGMRKHDVNEARFTLVYVRARLGKYEETAALLADMREARKGNRKPEPETLYLEMWVNLKLDKGDVVARIYQDHEAALHNLQDAKLIAGIAYLRLARSAWVRTDVAAALDYYKKIQRLDHPELKKRIPNRIDAEQIVVGIRALLDDRFTEARKQFNELLTGTPDTAITTLEAKIGLLLCDWREGVHLTTSLGELVRDTSLLPSLLGKTSSVTEEPVIILPPEHRLLRDARLWYVMTLINHWRELPAAKGLPSERLNAARAGLEDARAIEKPTDLNSNMNVTLLTDIDLVDGLLLYYYSKDEEGHAAGLELLRRYQANGGNLTDVIALIELEDKIADANRKSIKRFLGFARDYVQNPEVREDYRRGLQERLRPYQRFRSIHELEVRTTETDTAPSIVDLQNRTRLLRKRIEQVVKPRLSEVDETISKVIHEQVEQVDALTENITKETEKLEEAEFDLLAITGEVLLNEETNPAAPDQPSEG